MTIRIACEPIFILHTWPYRNTSLIVDVFSEQQGRFHALARSARGLKSRYRGMLQLFTPLLASWSGRYELMNMGEIELAGMPYPLSGRGLLCAFYLNELLQRLLHHNDPYPQLFVDYKQTLQALSAGESVEVSLRCFEKRLLDQLGYGLRYDCDVNGQQIEAGQAYQFIPERGFLANSAEVHDFIFAGESLLALHHEQWSNTAALVDTKRLLRIRLAHYLGGKPLKSRELFTVIGKVD